MKPYVVSDLVYSHFNVRVIKNDIIVWGYPQDFKYEIFVVNPEGKTIRKIVKEYDPVKVTEDDKEELKKKRFGDRDLPPKVKFEFPKNYYPYHLIICGDDGRIYVRTNEKNKEANYRYDVFSPEGRYIAKFYFPELYMICLVRKNKMYSMVWEDEKGIPVVKRYSMVWK
jgi:hypothetical protein